MQDRKALVVGIDEYASTPLFGCVADAKAVLGLWLKTGTALPISQFILREMLNLLMH